MNLDRIENLEIKVDAQGKQIARIDERQARMHDDLVANTESVRELTKSINRINSFIDNRKGAAWMLGIIVGTLASVSYAGAWLWDRFFQ